VARSFKASPRRTKPIVRPVVGGSFGSSADARWVIHNASFDIAPQRRGLSAIKRRRLARERWVTRAVWRRRRASPARCRTGCDDLCSRYAIDNTGHQARRPVDATRLLGEQKYISIYDRGSRQSQLILDTEFPRYPPSTVTAKLPRRQRDDTLTPGLRGRPRICAGPLSPPGRKTYLKEFLARRKLTVERDGAVARLTSCRSCAGGPAAMRFWR